MRSSYWLALAILVAVALWVLSGQFGSPPARGPSEVAAEVVVGGELPAVRVRSYNAQDYVRGLTLFGRTQASRRLTLAPETDGRVVDLPVDRGARVAAGDVLARIALDDRGARYAEAKALLAQRQIEYDAATQLRAKGYRSETSVADARAKLDAAKASLARMATEISQITVRAPFAGVIEDRSVELGAYVKRGEAFSVLVELDPILVVASVSERDAGQVQLGAIGTASLITGEQVEGVVSFIGSVADPATRTFRVELEVANPTLSLRDGLTCEVRLPVATLRAHHIAPSLLTLSDDGDVGVKAVGDGDKVQFLPVRIIADDADGLWIAGLPESVALITVGQEYVKDGQKARPVHETAGTP